MKYIRTLIVDDNAEASTLLKDLLQYHHPEIKIVAICANIAEAIEAIDSEQPNLVFLDIELPDGYGFDVLNKVTFNSFSVIFTTSFTEYAVRAFEFSAIHYLIKPITAETLKQAIDRFIDKTNHTNLSETLDTLRDLVNKKPRKILIPTGYGLELFNIDEIVRCEADGNYTVLYFNNKKHLLVSKQLQSFEASLAEFDFIRINRKYVVNLRSVIRFQRGKNPTITLIDGFEISISEFYLLKFKERFQSITAQLE